MQREIVELFHFVWCTSMFCSNVVQLLKKFCRLFRLFINSKHLSQLKAILSCVHLQHVLWNILDLKIWSRISLTILPFRYGGRNSDRGKQGHHTGPHDRHGQVQNNTLAQQHVLHKQVFLGVEGTRGHDVIEKNPRICLELTPRFHPQENHRGVRNRRREIVRCDPGELAAQLRPGAQGGQPVRGDAHDQRTGDRQEGKQEQDHAAGTVPEKDQRPPVEGHVIQQALVAFIDPFANVESELLNLSRRRRL